MTVNNGTITAEMLVAGFKMIDSNNNQYPVVLTGANLGLQNPSGEPMNKINIASDGKSISFGASSYTTSFVGYRFTA